MYRYACTSFGNGKSDYMYICSSQSCSKSGQRAIKKTLPYRGLKPIKPYNAER